MHTCMHTYIHACMHTYIHTYIHAWYKLPPCIGMHALGLKFGSAAQQS